MPAPETLPQTRDQKWALHAYRCVGGVRDHQKDYKIAVNDLGVNIIRSGLCAALAVVQRRGGSGRLLLDHLASAEVPGLEGASTQQLPDRVQRLNVEEYMIATREMLQVVTWLKRAAQTTFGGN